MTNLLSLGCPLHFLSGGAQRIQAKNARGSPAGNFMNDDLIIENDEVQEEEYLTLLRSEDFTVSDWFFSGFAPVGIASVLGLMVAGFIAILKRTV